MFRLEQGTLGFQMSQVISRGKSSCVGRSVQMPFAGDPRALPRPVTQPPLRAPGRAGPGRGARGRRLASPACGLPGRPAPPGARFTAWGPPGGHPGRGSHLPASPSARRLPGAGEAQNPRGAAWLLPAPWPLLSPAPQPVDRSHRTIPGGQKAHAWL